VNIYPYFRNALFKFIDEILEAVPGLKGFIGFDFICDKEDLFLIDINPRYTTSMSVISKCKDIHILDYINVSKNEQTGSPCEIKL
jgi:predicted ATP-grasp superfamily ATP-dependent carboligase